jgi:phage/plasmid-associated DNA primase
VFLNLEGSGGNGKGMISTLHSSALGDYAGTLNNNYLVNTFNSPESHNTMLANNYKKRYLQVNEPANTKNLNINLIKEMTGGDDIQLRIAHSAETKTVEPLFKLCMLFNEIPRIENTKDGGFIRRFIGINFPNRFVDREPKNLNEFRKDPNLKQKIKNNKEWHQQYMLILLDYLKKYIENNERLEVPERIKKNSQRLLGDQDPYTDFIASCVTITNVPTDYTRRDDMWDAFKKYYRENYPDKLRISSKMFADKMKQSFPDEVQFKVRMTIQVETGKKLVGNVFTGVKLNEDEQPTFSQYDF